ncbi:MAG: SIMPL domain-containing protein [Campylobacterota bacterium]|nr:SIMPL domain-containing protein [Campylobacterota bacterium]
MKEKIVLSLTLISISVSAVEISKSKTFTDKITPTVQSSSFSLQHRSHNDRAIEQIFKKAINIVKRGNICEGGQYRIFPVYKYINNQRVDDGYNSYINFNCEFKDIKEYEKVISNIKTLNTKITQDKISYITTVIQIDSMNKQLEQKAYDYSKSYKEYLSSLFGNCKTQKISFVNQHNKVPYPLRSLASAKSNEAIVTSPIKDDIDYSLNVNYTFKCID